MKKILLGLVFAMLIVQNSYAADIEFVWQPYPTFYGVESFTLYQRSVAGGVRTQVAKIPGVGSTSVVVDMRSITVDPVKGATLFYSLTANTPIFESNETKEISVFIPGLKTDTDQDQVTDLVEIDSGTDPNDAASFPANGGLKAPVFKEYRFLDKNKTVTIVITIN